MARGAAAIPARCPLGHDALEPELGGGRKEPDAVALEVVTELDRGPGILLDQPPEEHPPFHERLPPQILAIEMQEIEGEQHEPVRRRVDSRSKGMKIGVMPCSSWTTISPSIRAVSQASLPQASTTRL